MNKIMKSFILTLREVTLLLSFIATCLAGCTDNVTVIDFYGDICSYENLLHAAEGYGCSQEQLFGFLGVSDLAEAITMVNGLCPGESSLEKFKWADISNRGHQFRQEFLNGGSELNNAVNPDMSRIKWVEDNVLHKRAITFPRGLGENVNFCHEQTVMCCWTADSSDSGEGTCTDSAGCQDGEPKDNTDVCYVDIENNPFASHTPSGFAVYPDNKEGSANCMGFTWTNEKDNLSNLYKGNLLFEVAMRYGLKENGYTRSVPHAPMCACVEQMPVVSNADCRDVDSPTKAWYFTSHLHSDFSKIMYDGLRLNFNDCDGKDLATHYEIIHSKTISNPIQGGCSSAENKFIKEKGYSRQKHPVKWVLVAGKGAYGDPTLSEQFFDGDTRHSSMTREEFEELWARSERILLRQCRDCSPLHKEIYYKRLNETSLPSNVDILYDVKEHWQEYENNKWGENFDLYSSYSNAINENNPWKFTKLDKAVPMGLGFDSGPFRATEDQWNVWDTPYYNSGNGNTYFGQRSVGFYVAINPNYGQPTNSPTPEPTSQPTSSPTSSPTRAVVSLVGNTPLQIERNLQLGVVNNPSSEFIISFTLRPLGMIGSFSSIIRFSKNTNSNLGDRNPALFFYPNSYSILFTYWIGDEQKTASLHGLNANQDFDVKIEAIGNYVNLYINGGQQESIYVPLSYRLEQDLPLQVYAGDNFYDPANAKISNLVCILL